MRTLIFMLIALALVTTSCPASTFADTRSGTDLAAMHAALRASIGAPSISRDASVERAAQAHASYLSLNRTLGHYETPGAAGFTGVTPRERVAAQGLAATFVSEVAASYGSADQALYELWHAPYHRLGMMHPHAVLSGWGHSSGREATVGNFIYDFSSSAPDVVRSPAAGDTSVPVSWNGNESPSPLPEGVRGPVGYPIMLVYSGARRVDLRGAELVAPGGARVPFYIAPQLFESDYVVIIPRAPLAAATTYHVRFDLTVAGRWLTEEWDFRTSADGKFVPPAQRPRMGASLLDQTTLSPLAYLESAAVTVRLRNTGTVAWQRGVAGREVVLGIRGDDRGYAAAGLADGWLSAERVATHSEASVAPGAFGTFTFKVKSNGGSALIPLRPLIEGVEWLDGDVDVRVLSAAHLFHSAWLDQSPYPTLRAGEVSPPLQVRFVNIGPRAWIKGALGQEARLAVDRDLVTWAGLGVNWPHAARVAVQSEARVEPGQTATFSFQVRAPATPGVYLIPLRPVIDGTTWLEDQGVWLRVTVLP